MINNLVERHRAATAIAKRELAHIEHKYGSDNGPGHTEWLLYNNLTHTDGMLHRAVRLATRLTKEGRLDANVVPLIIIACAFHDHFQDISHHHDERDKTISEGAVGGSRRRSQPRTVTTPMGSVHELTNESASGVMAISAMQKFPRLFDREDMQLVMDMDLGTTATFTADGRIAQDASNDSLVQQIVADADLSGMGCPDGPLRALLLFAQIQVANGKMWRPMDTEDLWSSAIDVIALRKFLVDNERLMRTHRYRLDLSNELYGPGLLENADRTRQMTNELDRLVSNGQADDVFGRLGEMGHEFATERTMLRGGITKGLTPTS